MFGSILKFISEDKSLTSVDLFCQSNKISKEEFYNTLFTLEKELMIKKCFLENHNSQSHNTNTHLTSVLGYSVTGKGKNFLKVVN